MYSDFYGLSEKPFALSPDPRYLYLGSCHREALAHLIYGIEEGEGFIEVVGQVGTGKTTLCRTLLEQVGPDVELAFIFNPSSSEVELLAAINREFGLPTTARTRSELIDELNRFLLRRKMEGKRVLLVIDEAQNLDPGVLEQVRLLSNLETDREKLLQIILIGQPELEENLRRTDLRQLRQRITVRWSLRPFDREETGEYLTHRLRVAGHRGGDLFSPRAVRAIHRLSGGIPRVINAVADRALLCGYADSLPMIDAATVREAARELPASEAVRRGIGSGLSLRQVGTWVGLGLAAGLLVALLWPLATRLPVPSAVVPEQAKAPAEPAGVASPAPGLPAVSTASPPADPALRSLALALGTRTAPGSMALAVDAMLSAWGFPAGGVAEVAPNDLAQALGERSSLRVFSGRTTRARLARLDLPAILELEPQPGALRYAALVAADPGGWTLAVGGDTFPVASRDLDRWWTGRAFVPWTNYESLPALRSGMTGTAVRWVQARLTELGYLAPGDPSGDYDLLTLQAIRRLQTDYSLEPTGEVGPETLIALYRALQYGAPRLSTPEGVSGGESAPAAGEVS